MSPCTEACKKTAEGIKKTYMKEACAPRSRQVRGHWCCPKPRSHGEEQDTDVEGGKKESPLEMEGGPEGMTARLGSVRYLCACALGHTRTCMYTRAGACGKGTREHVPMCACMHTVSNSVCEHPEARLP